MKAEDILEDYSFVISKGKLSSEAVPKRRAIEYANQRVIEELDLVLSRLEGICDRSVIDDVEKRRDQLKQE